MKLIEKLSPKRLFRSKSKKDRTSVSRSDPSSFSSSSTSDSSTHNKLGSAPDRVGTPTSVLHEISGDWSDMSADISLDMNYELVQACKLLDRDNDGVVLRSELEALLIRLGADPPTQEELKETFDFFDADHDGKITAEELFGVFTKLGDELCTLDDCRGMIALVDKNGDGFVCFEDFSRMMELQR
ncbi:putative calcium-binding protein CML36 [Citrus sinensis]|nr:putative calcium-binding protein CML36 [Citrus sinensis]